MSDQKETIMVTPREFVARAERYACRRLRRRGFPLEAECVFGPNLTIHEAVNTQWERVCADPRGAFRAVVTQLCLVTLTASRNVAKAKGGR
jgi:hypothetical protein